MTIKFITSGIESAYKSYIEQTTNLIAKESKDPKDHRAIESCSRWVKLLQSFIGGEDVSDVCLNQRKRSQHELHRFWFLFEKKTVQC